MAGTPKSPNDYFTFVEGVVQMAGDLLNVQTTETGDVSLGIECASSGQQCQDPECLFELGDKDILMDPVFDPPGFLAPYVALGRGREPNPAGIQRVRSSRRISSASTRRF